MGPTLMPGDRVLAVRARRARAGALVVAQDPRHPSRLLVKRVVRAGPLGHTLAGDNPLASTDSRTFGPVVSLRGRVLFRYHPAHRAGWLH